MVPALAERAEHPDRHAGIARSGTADLLERARRDVMRAREGRERAARLEQAQRAEIDLLVAARGRVDRILAPGEWRRVEHDESEALARLLEPAQPVEGIAFPDLPSIVHAVQLEVPPRQAERVGRRVEQEGVGGAGLQRVTGEAAREAERVEHAPPGGPPSHERAILGLVEIEAGLVSTAGDDAEA